MRTEDKDLLVKPAEWMPKKHPSALVGNPEPLRKDELWRCARCGGSIRTNEAVRKGQRCKRCHSPTVVSAFPSFWEAIKLFFQTGTIYLEKKENE